MKKSVLAAMVTGVFLLGSTQASANFFGDNTPWNKNNNFNNYNQNNSSYNNWPQWTPMYWMEEMFGDNFMNNNFRGNRFNGGNGYNNGNGYNDWPQWTPMYWMEEMFGDNYSNNNRQFNRSYQQPNYGGYGAPRSYYGQPYQAQPHQNFTPGYPSYYSPYPPMPQQPYPQLAPSLNQAQPTIQTMPQAVPMQRLPQYNAQTIVQNPAQLNAVPQMYYGQPYPVQPMQNNGPSYNPYYAPMSQRSLQQAAPQQMQKQPTIQPAPQRVVPQNNGYLAQRSAVQKPAMGQAYQPYQVSPYQAQAYKNYVNAYNRHYASTPQTRLTPAAPTFNARQLAYQQAVMQQRAQQTLQPVRPHFNGYYPQPIYR